MVLVTPLEPAPQAGPDAALTASQRTLRLSLWSRIEVAVASQPAPHHRVNEDAHSLLPEVSRVLVLADGVGGGAMASQVSRRLVAALHEHLGQGPSDASSIRHAVLAVDREVRDFIAQRTREPGAATLALCTPVGRSASDWWIAWVGDCRVYAVGTGQGEPARLLTRDDSYRHLEEDPPPGGSPDDPARMVGNGAVDCPNTQQVRLRRGERLLLCSDGVHKHLTPHQIGELLQVDQPLAERCRNLVVQARAAGSTDDATVLVLERRRLPWVLGLAGALGLLLLLLGGLALWNAYGLGGRATPPVFEATPPGLGASGLPSEPALPASDPGEGAR